jgi:hypothetical protein
MRTVLIIILLAAATTAIAAPPLLPANYAAWDRPTTITLNFAIPGHLDNHRVIYLNKIGTTVQPASVSGKVRWDYPKGTIILKEAYAGLLAPAKDAKPIRLYGMVKDPGNPKAKGGWLWVVKDVATKKETIYDSAFCIDCHSYANAKHQYGDKNPNAEFRDGVYYPWFGKK